MKKIFSQTDKLYKVNLHAHTTESDGKMTPEQLKDLYKSNGYSAVAITDHEFMIDHTELNDDEFIILPGYEYAINNGGCSLFHCSSVPKQNTLFTQVPTNALS